MIQELLGGGIGVGSMSGSPGQDEQKKVNAVMSNIGGLTTIEASSNSSSSSSSEQHPNLRCPRCDSSNTKFCYYNNYNLTQPRHFCKTCRRYWTKGGALRNVPIGGGCRKSKTPVMSSVAGKSTSGKARAPIFTSDVGKVNMVSGVIDHQYHEQIAPHNSQLMALLRAADQSPSNYNPNHILNSVVVKDQVAGMLESNLFSDHASLHSGVMCSRSPLMGLCSSIWRSNSEHDQQQQLILPQLSLQQNFLLGQVSNINGFQDLHQRFRSSPSINYDLASSTQSSSMIINNPASDSSLTGSTNEAAAMVVGELGNWNNTLQWTDLSTSNGSIP